MAEHGIVDVSAAVAGRTSSVELYGTRTDYREDDVLAPYLVQLEDFAAAVAGEPSHGADGRAGIAVLELVEAAKAMGR